MNDKQQELMLNVSLVAILLNLVLPYTASFYATPEEVKPKNGVSELSFKSQIMHMLVHHSQVPLSSSVIIALIVIVAFLIASKM